MGLGQVEKGSSSFLPRLKMKEGLNVPILALKPIFRLIPGMYLKMQFRTPDPSLLSIPIALHIDKTSIFAVIRKF